MSAIDTLATELSRLPGIGRKTALRLTYHLLKRPPEEIRRLARALDNVSDRVRPCTRCGNLTELDPCSLCSSPRRDVAAIDATPPEPHERLRPELDVAGLLGDVERALRAIEGRIESSRHEVGNDAAEQQVPYRGIRRRQRRSEPIN